MPSRCAGGALQEQWHGPRPGTGTAKLHGDRHQQHVRSLSPFRFPSFAHPSLAPHALDKAIQLLLHKHDLPHCLARCFAVLPRAFL
jgi:hypothetical protein